MLAQDEGMVNHHAFIEIPHLIMGLLREEDGLAAKILKQQGIKIRDVSYFGIPELVIPSERDQVPMSSTVKKALELSLREALGLGHNYIGTEHILLGILRLSEDGTDYGLPQSLREAVLDVLNGPKRSAKPKPEEKHELAKVVTQTIADGITFLKGIRATLKLIQDELA